MIVKYKKQNILRVGSFRLIPGINDVPREAFEAALPLYPKLRDLIDEGVVEVFGKSGAVKDPPAPPPAAGEAPSSEPQDDDEPSLEVADLATLSEKKAVRMVKDTVDAAILTAWHGMDKRKSVVAAIEAQLETIAKAGEPTTEG